MPGWLLEKALPVSTRSPVPVPPWMYCNRSPRADVNVLFWIVTLKVAVPDDVSSTPSLPLAPLAPTVTDVNVSRLSEPLVLMARKLSAAPPAMLLVLTAAEPVRLSNATLASLNGEASFDPFVPLMTLSVSVKPVTLVPRIA